MGERNNLESCLESARQKLRDGVKVKKPKEAQALEQFLNGSMKIGDLQRECNKVTEEGEAFEKYEQLVTAISRVQDVMDTLLSAAPESVSMVWFGINTLISVGTVTITTRQQIYSTCSSITTMMEFCLRLEERSIAYDSKPPLDATGVITDPTVWGSDIPDLIFLILDFLWHVKPHKESMRGLKVYGKAIKETFTGTLDKKASALLDHYQTVVEKAKVLFENFLLRGNLVGQFQNEDIQKSLKGISKIADDLVDIVYTQTLREELTRQKEKIMPSKSHEIHFKALESRLADIMNQREIIKWLLRHDSYITFKQKNASRCLCIEAPRGHGKSVAMMRIYKDLLVSIANGPTPIVLRFFFKKGDQNIQTAQSALESLFFQLLNSDIVRNNEACLGKVIEILNPGFEGGNDGADASGWCDTSEKICATIKRIAAVLPNSVYLIVDALDECNDRREKNILKHLKSTITDPDTEDIRLLISARDTIGIKAELETDDFGEEGSVSQIQNGSPSITFITIGKEENSQDFLEYLKDEVFQVLSRLIDPSKSYFGSKAEKIVANIHGKASGDFTRARLIVTNLKDPSRIPMEKKIEELPDSIGDIYMASLEALTPNQQEFVVTALKLIVWGVSNISVIEISDFYRQKFLGGDAKAEEGNEPQQSDMDEDTEPGDDISSLLPYDERNLGSEVKETIYHITEAGRDFFRYDAVTGFVTVDISVREWITKDASSKGSLRNQSAAHGFKRFRNNDGFAVFQLTMTPAFVKYGDFLSPLFSERDAQLSFTLEILRTLNNQTFQEKYMPLNVRWAEQEGPKYRSRYEIDHWHDHFRIMQTWWTEDSMDDPWWSELLRELDLFTQSDNWYRWNIQRRPEPSSRWVQGYRGSYRSCWHFLTAKVSGTTMRDEETMRAEFSMRFYQGPLQLASEYGLHMLVDYILRRDQRDAQSLRLENLESDRDLAVRKSLFFGRRLMFPDCGETLKSEPSTLLTHKLDTICRLYQIGEFRRFRRCKKVILPKLRLVESLALANYVTYKTFLEQEFYDELMKDLAKEWDTEVRVAWLADLENLQRASTHCLEPGDEERVREHHKKYPRPANSDFRYVSPAWDEILSTRNEVSDNSPNTPDMLGRVPLFLGATYPKVVKTLVNHDADINSEAFTGINTPLIIELFYEAFNVYGPESTPP
ncbi:hypothetical protein H072_11064 [Dactylellina haptotyla CBS 200.50]|uniref:Nephrocystin 3-like N-terminal domain-containing protein n=1 Tax=Dactylellina haptotyla (strain CBS 200.50) TaxID=1284197 RepID=S7ZXN5_DACHA|nr:hypothetical protein H072_11064 [Dactylellina haptotyla CBS 200.50]